MWVFVVSITLKVCGKWVLVGEYSVLYGGKALVFPLPSQFMEIKYFYPREGFKNKLFVSSGVSYKELKSRSWPFAAILSDKTPSAYTLLWRKVLNLALKKVSKKKSALMGRVYLKTNTPLGAGLGVSAQVCVLVGLLFHRLGWIKKENLFSFCHVLENTFHGRSSGMDIAVVLKNQSLLYTKKAASLKSRFSKIKTFQPQWKPLIFLSLSGKTPSSTLKGVEKVKLFKKKHPVLAKKCQHNMEKAVLLAARALRAFDNRPRALKQLCQAFLLAEECFSQWGLMGLRIKQQSLYLKEQGALAVKPTGSGGGCLLSLWSKKPPAHLPLLPVF